MDPPLHLNNIVVAAVFCVMLYKIVAQQCESDFSSLSMMLQRHTYKTFKTSSVLECDQACNDDFRCQSFNYVFLENICELNNRTKEARPEDFIFNPRRYYSRRKKKLVLIGSVAELPAETCKEIKASDGERATSGKYWFNSLLPGEVIQAECNMETEDIDECKSRVKPCDVNADCQNIRGSYVCTCKAGFNRNGNICTDINECSALGPVCDANAKCENIIGSYLCSCKSGFFGNGKTCTDYDECSASVVACDPLASCQNTAGSFLCLCQSGYTGDGRTCIGVDECHSGSFSCHAQGQCINVMGSYDCRCLPGYTGDGQHACSDVDECQAGSHSCHA